MAATINADNGVSSGSAGLKSSADSSGVLQLQTNGTAAVTVDTSQNVGIGTATPANKLEVSSAINIVTSKATSGLAAFNVDAATGNAAYHFFRVNGTESARVYSDVGNYLGFATGSSGTERMRIDSSGNVGIGTSSPTSKLDVLSASGGNTIFSRNTGTASSDSAQMQCVNGSVVFQAYAYSFSGEVVTGSASNHPYSFRTNSVERMRIDSSGNVGIGTSSPADLLVVRKDQAATTRIRVANKTGSSAATAGILFENSTSDTGSVALWDAGTVGAFTAYGLNIEGSGSGGVNIGAANASGVIRFATGGTTERARIDSSGNLLVGTTSVSGLVSAQRNTAGSYSAAFGARAIGTAQGQVAGYMFLPTFTGTGDNTPRRAADIWAGFNGNWTGEYLVFGVGTGAGNDAGNQTVERMRIDAGGNLTITGATATKASGTTWANPSDQRLKDNIRDYVKGTTELMQVRVREWEYNGKGGTTEGMKGLGVIADEVMTVLPSTVENYDAKLNADDEETTAIKKFDATEITWLLVKTVQEQQAVIAQLQADVATFKGASA